MLLGDKNRKLKILIITAIVVVVGFLVLSPVLAQVNTGLGSAGEIGLGQNHVKTIIVRIIQVLLGFLGILAVIIILYGGFLWMTASGDPTKIGKAKKLLLGAVIGLIIILSSYTIAYFVFDRIGWATGFWGFNDPVYPPPPPPPPDDLRSDRYARIYRFGVDDLGDGVGWHEDISSSFSGTLDLPIASEVVVGGKARNRNSLINSAELYIASEAGDDFTHYSNFDVPTDRSSVNRVSATWNTLNYDVGTIKQAMMVAKTPEDAEKGTINSRAIRTKMLPAHCFNKTLDTDQGETQEDCGGECGACPGEDCNTSGDSSVCVPNNDECRRGTCLIDSCTCAKDPIITRILPADGAAGNYITIWGRYFGNDTGRILFYTAPDAYALADLPLAGNCGDTWSDRQIIFEVPTRDDGTPFSVGEYKIQVETNPTIGALLSNSEDFEVTTTTRPGICKVNNITSPDPEPVRGRTPRGLYPDEVGVYGTNFTGGDIVWAFDTNLTSTVANIRDDESATDVVPDNRFGFTSIRVYKDRFSNPFTFLASRGGEGGSCGEFDDVLSACSDESICATGLTCRHSDCTCQYDNGGNDTECQPGDRQTCSDAEDCPNVQICSSDGTWGACEADISCGYLANLTVKPAAQAIYTWDFSVFRSGAGQLCKNNNLDENEACDTVNGSTEYANGSACSNYQENTIGTISCSDTCEVNTDNCISSDYNPRAVKPAAQAIYTWDFNVFKGDTVSPRIIEDCSRSFECNDTLLPSPTPWQGWKMSHQGVNKAEACVNAVIGARFNVSMRPETVKSAIEVYNCGDGMEVGSCTPLNIPSDNFDFYGGNQGFTLDPGSGWYQANTWYKVIVRDGVRSVFGDELIKSPSLLTERECNIDDTGTVAYCWNFKTRNNEEKCDIGCLGCVQDEEKLKYIGETNNYNGKFDSDDNVCLTLTPAVEGYSWNSNKPIKVGLSVGLEAYLRVGTAGGETIFDQPEDYARITVEYDNKIGTCKTYVDLTNPAVVEDRSCHDGTTQSPTPFVNDEDACTNAVVSARFDIPMVDTSITGEPDIDPDDLNDPPADPPVNPTIAVVGDGSDANVKIYKCNAQGSNCETTPLSGVINVFEYSREILYNDLLTTGEINQEADLPEGFAVGGLNLEKNTWYRVVIKGGSNGVKAAKKGENGTYDENTPVGVLIGSADDSLGDYFWDFKTSDYICNVDTILVSPAQKFALERGETEKFTAVPNASNCNWIDDSDCSFDWDWKSLLGDGQTPAGPGADSADNIAQIVNQTYGCGATWNGVNPADEPNLANNQIYTSGDEGHAYIQALLFGKSGYGEFQVGLANLNIVNRYPVCSYAKYDYGVISTEICLDADIGVKFSIPVQNNTLGTNNVKLYKVASTSTVPTVAMEQTIVTNGASSGDTNELLVNLVNDANLDNGQMYRLVVKGGPNGIISTSNKQLNILSLNYDTDGDDVNDSYSWVFQAKETDELCELGRIEVIPINGKTVVGPNVTDQPYVAVPYSVGDACNDSEGQRLKAWRYDWDWNIGIDNVYNADKFIFVNRSERTTDNTPIHPTLWKAWAKVQTGVTASEVAMVTVTTTATRSGDIVSCEDSGGKCSSLSVTCPNDYNVNKDSICNDNGLALDVHGCCVNRPVATAEFDGTHVCPNAVLSIQFDQSMDYGSFAGNVQITEEDCSIALESPSWWSRTKSFFRRLFSFVGLSEVSADTLISFDYTLTEGNTGTVMRIWPKDQNLWTRSLGHRVRVLGDSDAHDDIREGVKTSTGVTMDGDKEFTFCSATELCRVDQVGVEVRTGVNPRTNDPVYYNQDNFFCFEQFGCGNTTINSEADNDAMPSTDGNQHLYTARAYSAGQEIRATYSFKISGMARGETNNDILSVNDVTISNPPSGPIDDIDWGSNGENWFDNTATGDDGNILVSAFRNYGTEIGRANIKVTATSVADAAGLDEVNSISRSIPVRIISCNNPWPNAENFPYQDSDGNCKTGTCINTNFETWYCKDNDGGDLLPDIGKYMAGGLTFPVLGDSDAHDDIVKDFFLFQDDADFALGDANVIGLRVMNNNNHLAPITWYREHFDKDQQGNLQSIKVDGYEAVKEGRTIYANAADLGDNGVKIFNKVYIASYNEGASDKTINIYNQLVDNLKFNVGSDGGALNSFGQCGQYTREVGVIVSSGRNCMIDSNCQGDDYCLSDKAKLVRDTKRLSDAQYVNYLLSDSEVGYYNQRRCSNDPSVLCENLSTAETVLGGECDDCGGGENHTIYSPTTLTYHMNLPYDGNYILTLYTSNSPDPDNTTCEGDAMAIPSDRVHDIKVSVGPTFVGQVSPQAINNVVVESSILLRDLNSGSNEISLKWTNDCCSSDCHSNLKVYALKLSAVNNSECYGGGFCGNYNIDLKAGTYVAGRSSSVWPSWQSTLGNLLGSALPVDPINKIYGCDAIAGADATTCWDATNRVMNCRGTQPYYYIYKYNVDPEAGFIGKREFYVPQEFNKNNSNAGDPVNWHIDSGDSRGAWDELKYFRYNYYPNPFSLFGASQLCGSGTCENGIFEDSETCLSCPEDAQCTEQFGGDPGMVCMRRGGGDPGCYCQDFDNDGYPDVECPSSEFPKDNCPPPAGIELNDIGRIVASAGYYTSAEYVRYLEDTFGNINQDNSDGDNYGDKCDICPAVYNNDQTVNEVCTPTTYGEGCDYLIKPEPNGHCAWEHLGPAEYCGDGDINGPESCDDEEGNDPDTYFDGDKFDYTNDFATNEDNDGNCIYSLDGVPQNQQKRCEEKACGDGYRNKNAVGYEQCDDGNNDVEHCKRGDESCQICNANCELEAGEPSYCGDKAVNGGERCDNGKHCANGDSCLVDGNCLDGSSCETRDGNGCTADCDAVETGYSCDESGNCTTECGDNEVANGIESCDDGKHCANGDQCYPGSGVCSDDSACIPRNFGGCVSDCSGTTRCGDGSVQASQSEECDLGDNNVGDIGINDGVNGDGLNGCNDDCTCDTAHGWGCSSGLPEPVCGDGYLAGYEYQWIGVDYTRPYTFSSVVNTYSYGSDESIASANIGDQCDWVTVVNNCPAGIATCRVCDTSCKVANATGTYCGDGVKNGDEECDTTDGRGASAYDGCDNSSCECLAGWDCSGVEPVSNCGDGVIAEGVGGEVCDQGNWNRTWCDYNSDASSDAEATSQCKVTFNGTTKDYSGASLCDGTAGLCDWRDASIHYCGDSRIDGVSGENCDDGNHGSGDGCSDSCQVEPGWNCVVVGEACVPYCGNQLTTYGNSIVGSEWQWLDSEGASHPTYLFEDDDLVNYLAYLPSTRVNKSGDESIAWDVLATIGKKCDWGDYNSSICPYGVSDTDCKVCSGSCEIDQGTATYCGNGEIETSGFDVNGLPIESEECDFNGPELGGLDCTNFSDRDGKNFIGGTLGCFDNSTAQACHFDVSNCIRGFDLNIKISSAMGNEDGDPDNGIPETYDPLSGVRVRIYNEDKVEIFNGSTSASGFVFIPDLEQGKTFNIVVSDLIVNDGSGVCYGPTPGYPDNCPDFLSGPTLCHSNSGERWPNCRVDGSLENPESFRGIILDPLTMTKNYTVDDPYEVSLVPYALNGAVIVTIDWKDTLGGMLQNIDAYMGFYQKNTVYQATESRGGTFLDVDQQGASGLEVIRIKTFESSYGSIPDYYYYIRNQKERWDVGSFVVRVYDNTGGDFNRVRRYEVTTSGGYIIVKETSGDQTITYGASGLIGTIGESFTKQYWKVFALRYNPASGLEIATAAQSENTSFTSVQPFPSVIDGSAFYPLRLLNKNNPDWTLENYFDN